VTDAGFVELAEEPVIASLVDVVLFDASVVDKKSVEVTFDSEQHSKIL